MPWKKTVVSWIRSFPRSETFNNPPCDPAVFNASCITKEASLYGVLDDPLGPSYKLVDAHFNVYAVSPETSSPSAIFVVMVSGGRRVSDVLGNATWKVDSTHHPQILSQPTFRCL